MKKNIWFLSNISSKMYGDSTRPYFLGKFLNKHFLVSQYCNVSKQDEISYYNFFDKTFFSNPISSLTTFKPTPPGDPNASTEASTLKTNVFGAPSNAAHW